MNTGAESGVLEDAQIIQQPELFYLFLIPQCFPQHRLYNHSDTSFTLKPWFSKVKSP